MKKLTNCVALLLMSIGVNAQNFKYQSIWSMYSDKKLIKMPKYNVEESESFSVILWNDKAQTIIITTSSPDGEDKNIIKVTAISKEGNTNVYKGNNARGKMIIAINPFTKWIVITNMQNGNLIYEYHKIE